MNTRRRFLKAMVAGIATALGPAAGFRAESLGAAVAPQAGPRPSLDPWTELPRILSRIRPPRFPDRAFEIRRYGAVGDGHTDCTEAFRRAIEACHQAGGGRVVVPAGTFLTGAIHLLSRVNLHLVEGATIRFSRDPRNYPLVFTRYEGIELMNFSPFVYAFAQEDIAITGPGTLDGQADSDHWWNWVGAPRFGWRPGMPNLAKDRERLHELGAKGTPVKDRVFGLGHYLRPNFVQPYRCRNVLIEGITILNSPMWNLHPTLSENVIVRGVTVRSSGPNTDGCDPESCRDVLIENCVFETGDDCIAIKSGRDNDGRRLHAPTENVVIRGCRMLRGHGGVTVGSEISGGVRGIYAERCRMAGPELYDAVRLKNNTMRGGRLERIYARDIRAEQVSNAGLSIDDSYGHGAGGTFVPVVRDVELRNVQVGRARYALDLRGLPSAPIENVRLIDCDFPHADHPSVVQYVDGLVLRGVRINGKPAGTVRGPGSPPGSGEPPRGGE